MNKRIVFALLFIASITILSFLPTFQNGWTTWDDDVYVIDNPVIQNFSFGGIAETWTNQYNGSYLPLTIMSYMVEYHYGGFNPKLFHGTNLFFHVVNALLVFWLILVLDGNINIALLVAVLFGIHPMHVESVAWISGRKDVLSMFFFLLSMVSYLYYLKNKKQFTIGVSLLCFLLALVSKVIVITLPILLLLIDMYYERKDWIQSLIEKIPFFVLAVVFSIIGYFAQTAEHAVKKTDSVVGPIIVALHGVTFYLEKLILPVNLSSFYPYTKDLSLQFYFYAAVTIVIFYLLWRYSNNRVLLFGFLFYLISLLPVLQFVRFSQIFAADRFTYIPYIGLFFIVAKWGVEIWEKISGKLKTVAILCALLIAGTLSTLTWERTHVWKNTTTLWNDVLTKYPHALSGI